MSKDTRGEVMAASAGAAPADAEGEEGRSYVFLRSLSGSKIHTIQGEIMQKLEAIMVGQKGAEVGPDEATIQEDMTILNEYVWHLLTQEVASQGRLKKELAEFLQTNTEEFVSWLDTLLARHDPEASASAEEGALDGAETPPSVRAHSGDKKGRYRSDVSPLSRDESRHGRSSRRSAESSDRYRSRHRASRHYEDCKREDRHRRRHEESREDRHRSRRRRDYDDRSRSPYSRRDKDYHRSPDQYHSSSHPRGRHEDDRESSRVAHARDGDGRAGRLIGLAVKQATGAVRRSGGAERSDALQGHAFPASEDCRGMSRRSRSRSAGRVRAIVLVDERGAVRGRGESAEERRDDAARDGAPQADVAGLNGEAAATGKTKAILRPNPRYAAGGGAGSPALLSDRRPPFLSSPSHPAGAARPGAGFPGSPHDDLSRHPHGSNAGFGEPYQPSYGAFPASGAEMDMEMGVPGAPGEGSYAPFPTPANTEEQLDLNRGGAAFLAVGGSAGPKAVAPGLGGGDPAGAQPFAPGKVRKRCIKWPRCPFGANCMYIHPTAKCTKWPRCAFGDACFYWHPAVMCKFGANCANPFCNYTHEPIDPSLAAAAASAVGASLPTGDQTGAAESPAQGVSAGSHGDKATGAGFLGTRGHDGFYRNKTWTPGNQDASGSSASNESGQDLQSSVEALSHTLPGTPPELRRRREEEANFQGEGKPLLLPPAAAPLAGSLGDGAAGTVGEGDEEGVMEG
uniref:Zinc finger (CCCH type) protein, putative n=1 Tax=Neospora caninum (strain Liverpool) TaxID=572307 RepID=A0A0F7UI09_NEOCL|nr:TPA: zinc finger (CCCH type) protein, putative [Neospora caninum Liverpool]